ncbi:helix-turn-helix domain-containing protein [Pedobacter sp. UYP30]|uniref:helix-turn-helix transcriptional regulator n=1 Tax=Pedobacter sp. UYP30 TaxID=1756400 RepID=UPI003392DC9A
MEERGILKKDLAQALEILPNNLSLLFAGKKNISAQLALKIGNSLGTSAEYW